MGVDNTKATEQQPQAKRIKISEFVSSLFYHILIKSMFIMASHSVSSSSSSSYSSSSSHSSSSSASSGNMIQQQLTEVLLSALRTDRPRLYREFYYPEHISLTGHYYPRYRVTG